ncbi:MAG: HEPN/Toprim-associated domain-containing protein, partial [Thermodesulfobacteriota bacterium]|nr:HEPN/Toprim-associated domain-containing protein [Thermodesulfobacteriota bacterium]
MTQGALNEANAEVEVTWEFGPIVHAGWVQREAFQPGARQRQKVLIATEGASDARIIRRSLDVLRPDVADFFNFVDVDERHHFWGTGNLVKFAEGLLRIEVLNQVLFVFDNDAEGVDAFRKLEKLKLPGNMRAMLLPDLE